MQEIEISRWHSSNFMPCLGLPSKSHCGIKFLAYFCSPLVKYACCQILEIIFVVFHNSRDILCSLIFSKSLIGFPLGWKPKSMTDFFNLRNIKMAPKSLIGFPLGWKPKSMTDFFNYVTENVHVVTLSSRSRAKNIWSLSWKTSKQYVCT